MLTFVSPTCAELSSMSGLHFLDAIVRAVMSFTSNVKRLTLNVVAGTFELFVLSFLAMYYITETIILTFTPSFMRNQKSLKGKVVLVTGGAGGVGQHLVLRLARAEANVVVWDINEEAMEKLSENLNKEGYKVHTYQVDLTDKKSVYKNADLVKSDVGNVDILINNAGIVCGNTFLDIPDYMVEKTFQVNILSHYWTVKSFLGDMIKKGKGHIVTISSASGLLGMYKCTDYSASKYATVGFHESLQTELKVHGHRGIKMTIVCPSLINTDMFSGCKAKNLRLLEPKDVAKRIITAIRREENFVTMPGWSRFVLPLKNFVPFKLSWAVFVRLIKGPQMMMNMRPFQETAAA